MNGIHDLGGMDGFGPVERNAGEPVFRETWEGHVFAMSLALLAQGRYNADEFRHSIERMDPAHYLASGYYEHWLDGVARLLREKGVVDAEELEARLEATRKRRRSKRAEGTPNPALAEGLRAGISAGAPTLRDPSPPARFRAGDDVVVRRVHPAGHTRCPRYVRGARGRVERCHGSFVLPDASAHGRREVAEPLYTVRFDAAEIWGDAEKGASLCVDLWESYLEEESR